MKLVMKVIWTVCVKKKEEKQINDVKEEKDYVHPRRQWKIIKTE